MTPTNNKNGVFIKITNRDIYEELREVHNKVTEISTRTKANRYLINLLLAFNLGVMASLVYYALS